MPYIKRRVLGFVVGGLAFNQIQLELRRRVNARAHQYVAAHVEPDPAHGRHERRP